MCELSAGDSTAGGMVVWDVASRSDVAGVWVSRAESSCILL